LRETLRTWLEGVLGTELPDWLVPNQAMLIAVGFTASAIAAVILARRARLPMRNVALGLSACFVGAVVGSKLMGSVMRPDIWLHDWTALFDPRRGGATSFGALLGGCLGFWLYCWRARQDLWTYADAMVPAAGLGLFFARIGCFVHGCDFGRITSLPWGVRYPADSMAWNTQLDEGFIGPHQLLSLPVQPFQLMLAVFDLGIFVAFLLMPNLGRGRGPGHRALIAGFVYFGGRFVLEFMRSPWSAAMVGFLNVAQWMALLSMVVLFALWRARGQSASGVAPSQAVEAES